MNKPKAPGYRNVETLSSNSSLPPGFLVPVLTGDPECPKCHGAGYLDMHGEEIMPEGWIGSGYVRVFCPYCEITPQRKKNERTTV